VAVIFRENALLEVTLDKLFTYIKSVEKEYVWGSSTYQWAPNLIVNKGVVLTHPMPVDLKNSIVSELIVKNIIPNPPKSCSMAFYSWQAGSNIAWHRDYPVVHAMTIYLSKDWNPDHGGHFCWRDWDETWPKDFERTTPPEEGKKRSPAFNSCVRLTEGEWHSTTITTLDAPPRLSLQLFFDQP